jgi:hypothetical protein
LILLLAGFFGVVELSMITIFITLFFLLLGILGIVFELCIFVYGDDWVASCNGLNILEKRLQPSNPKSKKTPRFHKLKQDNLQRTLKNLYQLMKTRNNIDIFGLTLNLIGCVCGFYPYFVVLFGVIIFQLDVFSQFLNYCMLPNIILHNFYAKGVYHMVRLAVTVFGAIQVCRIASFFLINITIASFLMQSFISHLDRVTTDSIAFCSRLQYTDQMSQILLKYVELALLSKIEYYIVTTICFF